MQMKIIDSLSAGISVEEIQKKLRITEEDGARELHETAVPLIHARAAYVTAYVDNHHRDEVRIEGRRFKSRVLGKNLEKVGRVFPFLLTIGEALENSADSRGDMLEKYYLDEIGNMALRRARVSFERHLRETFALEKIGCMSPGSLKDWPIEEQRPLFDLLGEAGSALKVRLTSSFLMLPRKSLSGIYFPSETTFFSCQLCPREHCDARKAPYSEDLARKYGILEE
jgi:hypothetical protein